MLSLLRHLQLQTNVTKFFNFAFPIKISGYPSKRRLTIFSKQFQN